jgi:hypothetical protein
LLISPWSFFSNEINPFNSFSSSSVFFKAYKQKQKILTKKCIISKYTQYTMVSDDTLPQATFEQDDIGGCISHSRKQIFHNKERRGRDECLKYKLSSEGKTIHVFTVK